VRLRQPALQYQLLSRQNLRPQCWSRENRENLDLEESKDYKGSKGLQARQESEAPQVRQELQDQQASPALPDLRASLAPEVKPDQSGIHCLVSWPSYSL